MPCQLLRVIAFCCALLASSLASAQSTDVNLECSTSHAASKTLAEFVQAYEANDLATIRNRLDPALIGYQRFLDGLVADFSRQKQLRLFLKDTQMQCGPDVTVINVTWEKRFLELNTFQPGFLTGRMSILLHRNLDQWRMAAVGGDSPFGTAASGAAADLTVAPAVDISPLSVVTSSMAAKAKATPINLPFSLNVVDADQAGRGSVQIVVTSSKGDRETFTLTESSPGRFTRANMPFQVATATPGDGVLQVEAGCVLTVRYADLNPGNNRPATVLTRTVPTTGTPSTIDALPDAFSFIAVSNASPGATVTSNAIAVTGINTSVPIGITGGTYSVNGGAFTAAPGGVGNGAMVQVRVIASAAPSTPVTATLNIGGVSGAFVVSTGVSDTTPDAFTFAPLSGVPTSSINTSAPIMVSGINAPAPISTMGGTYSINGGPFTAAAGTVNNGAMVQLQVIASPAASTPTSATLTIGGVSGTFTVTTAAVVADTTPNPFFFPTITNIGPSTVMTSSPQIISGIDAPTPVSISGGGGQYSINGGPYTSAPGSITNGQNFSVRVTTSPATDGTGSVSTTLNIGGVTGTFTVTTHDTVPNAFSFANSMACPAGTIDSAPVVMSGLSGPANIAIADGAGAPAAAAMYSINGGAFTASPGIVLNGQSVVVRVTRWGTATPLTVRATVTIGGVVGTWSTFC
jgi:hypothetical protein